MSSIYKSGHLQVIFGPMKSGKSREFISIFDELKYSSHTYIIFKPAVNVREEGVVSRAFNFNLNAVVIDEERPELIFEFLREKNYQIVGIDEAQFFSHNLIDVVDKLLKKDYHVIVSGLLLSFRGEAFGPMPGLVGRSDEAIRLTAICEVPQCNRRATRTQRLINGEPAPYNSPLVIIENQNVNEVYEARCVLHHFVPKGKK